MTPEELRQRRKRLGLTQAQLAELLGRRSNSEIARWESGRLPATRAAWLDQEMRRVEREYKRPTGRPPKARRARLRCDCGRFSTRVPCASCRTPAPEPSEPAGAGGEG